MRLRHKKISVLPSSLIQTEKLTSFNKKEKEKFIELEKLM